MPPTGTPAADLSEEKMFPETVAGWGRAALAPE